MTAQTRSDMSTPFLLNVDTFDVLFKDLFKDSERFIPAYGNKLPHPLDIYETPSGLTFEVACTGISKDSIRISTEDRDILKITYDKPKETVDKNYIHRGIASRSFNLAYKIAPKFDLEHARSTMENGLLRIMIPYAEESKPRILTIE